MNSRSRIAGGLTLTLLAFCAHAQPMFRTVTPDGRVVFSDVPPPDATARVAPIPSSGAAAPDLPYALRQVTQRFPVTLYSGPDCAPCNSGRALLVARGIPYTEHSVSSQADVQALQQISGERNLPLLTIGSQHLKGFSGAQWHQYLDAAGYPRNSALPAGWQSPRATPLAPQATAVPVPPGATAPGRGDRHEGQAPPPMAETGRRAAPAPAPARSDSNPAGIQF